MSANNIWDKENWTRQARHLIVHLPKFPKTSQIIIILRHSYRDDSDDMWKLARMKLTDVGHAVARKFGSLLPIERDIQLNYSSIERCKETAEDILIGFRNSGGTGELKHSLKELFDVGMNAELFFDQILKYQYEEFIYRWAGGLYSKEVITPFEIFCRDAADVIWKQAQESPDTSLFINVSHDLITLSFRLGWFGLSPSDYWPSFLGGFAFGISDEEILLLDYDGFKTIEVPFWWRDK